MTQTANPTLTDVHDMVVVHRVFRRELRLLPELVREVAPGDTARAAVLSSWARMVLQGLHGHHTSEDLLLWPKLLERCQPDAELVHRMEEQHERVHAALDALGPALDRWEAEARPAVSEEVAAGFDALCVALLEHLDEEERPAHPLRRIPRGSDPRGADAHARQGPAAGPDPDAHRLRPEVRAPDQPGAGRSLIVPASGGTSSGRNPRPRSQARRNASSPSSARTAGSHCRATSRSGGKVTATDPASAVAEPAANSSAASSDRPRRAASTASPGTV